LTIEYTTSKSATWRMHLCRGVRRKLLHCRGAVDIALNVCIVSADLMRPGPLPPSARPSYWTATAVAITAAAGVAAAAASAASSRACCFSFAFSVACSHIASAFSFCSLFCL
jgi:tellurite resistance protein TehA-like permease